MSVSWWRYSNRDTGRRSQLVLRGHPCVFVLIWMFGKTCIWSLLTIIYNILRTLGTTADFKLEHQHILGLKQPHQPQSTTGVEGEKVPRLPSKIAQFCELLSSFINFVKGWQWQILNCLSLLLNSACFICFLILSHACMYREQSGNHWAQWPLILWCAWVWTNWLTNISIPWGTHPAEHMTTIFSLCDC